MCLDVIPYNQYYLHNVVSVISTAFFKGSYNIITYYAFEFPKLIYRFQFVKITCIRRIVWPQFAIVYYFCRKNYYEFDFLIAVNDSQHRLLTDFLNICNAWRNLSAMKVILWLNEKRLRYLPSISCLFSNLYFLKALSNILQWINAILFSDRKVGEVVRWSMCYLPSFFGGHTVLLSGLLY